MVSVLGTIKILFWQVFIRVQRRDTFPLPTQDDLRLSSYVATLERIIIKLLHVQATFVVDIRGALLLRCLESIFSSNESNFFEVSK